MSSFRYRLDLLLRLARVRVSEHRRELALVLREVAGLEASAALCQEKIRDNDRELVLRRHKGITGGELARFHDVAERATGRLRMIEDRLVALLDRESELRSLLKAASREVKVLEKQYREQEAAYLRELARREQAGVDDVVLVRKARDARHAGQTEKQQCVVS